MICPTCRGRRFICPKGSDPVTCGDCNGMGSYDACLACEQPLNGDGDCINDGCLENPDNQPDCDAS